MMLTKIQLTVAIRYNATQCGKLYDVGDMPWPWSEAKPDLFAWATANFQLENRLTVDGKMGPKTFRAVMKAEGDTSVEVPIPPKDPSLPKPPTPPPYGKLSDSKFSNAIIVDGERVELPSEFLAAGMTASNYLEDDEPHFKHGERVGELIHFVLHETCGNTAQGCKNTLKKKGYGVQLILAPSGHLSCHGDLVRDRMVHANQLNDTSFGIEIVNPYNPIFVNDKAIWYNTLKRLWWTWVPALKTRKGINKGIQSLLKRRGLKAVPKRYVTPTPPQMAAIRLLVPWLCELTSVPYRFPTKGLNKKKRKIDGLTMKPRGRPGPGVVAHRDFASHADGRYILEDLLVRKG